MFKLKLTKTTHRGKLKYKYMPIRLHVIEAFIKEMGASPQHEGYMFSAIYSQYRPHKYIAHNNDIAALAYKLTQYYRLLGITQF